MGSLNEYKIINAGICTRTHFGLIEKTFRKLKYIVAKLLIDIKKNV